jgi:signal transduction histidine kinase
MTKEKEIDKAKTEFVSLASHQLRTPLSTVNWYAEMLLAGDAGELGEKQKKYLDEVYRSNQRMVELVNALLDVSSLELGTFVIDPERVDICKLAENVIDEQRPQIDMRKIRFSFSCDKNVSFMQADPKLLRMVMQNILSNAVKYTPEKGRVELNVSVDNDKQDLQIKISDTGYGIPKNQQDKIFTKLFRADNVRDKDTDGTGLGLYIVKSIVENSGGKVWFESAGGVGNKGTTFFVTLPLKIRNLKK